MASCNEDFEQDLPEIEATIVYSVETDLLSRKNSLVIGSGGMVYTTNVDGFAIRKYGATGDLLARAGSRGEAPGEFTSGPRVISYDAGQVIVSGNLVNRMLHVFNDRLAYLDRYRLEDFPLSLTAHEGAVYLPMVAQNDNGGIHVEVVRRDANGTKSALFPVGEPIRGLHDMRGLMFSGGSLATDGKVMAYAYNFRNINRLLKHQVLIKDVDGAVRKATTGEDPSTRYDHLLKRLRELAGAFSLRSHTLQNLTQRGKLVYLVGKPVGHVESSVPGNRELAPGPIFAQVDAENELRRKFGERCLVFFRVRLSLTATKQHEAQKSDQPLSIHNLCLT